jgi:hypothetical protein
MPHKHNADRRRHIPKMSFKVLNWPAYEAGLRRRCSLTLWIEDGALEHWQTRGQGGQARYTDAAIQTNLMLGAAFKLRLRQTEGLMVSVITLMGLTISAPDHTTVSRRALRSPGRWCTWRMEGERTGSQARRAEPARNRSIGAGRRPYAPVSLDSVRAGRLEDT